LTPQQEGFGLKAKRLKQVSEKVSEFAELNFEGRNKVVGFLLLLKNQPIRQSTVAQWFVGSFELFLQVQHPG